MTMADWLFNIDIHGVIIVILAIHVIVLAVVVNETQRGYRRFVRVLAAQEALIEALRRHNGHG